VSRRARASGLAVLALVGVAVSGYLASYELGWIARVWDPLFGDGSERVLSSGVARALPVPDAVVGTAAYAVEAVLALLLAARIGSAVAVSAVLAVVASAGALVGIGLAISQPVLVGTFCTLCLVSTLVSIVLAAGAIGEAAEVGSWPDRARHEEVAR
jgi:uncharacterized membrane protein